MEASLASKTAPALCFPRAWINPGPAAGPGCGPGQQGTLGWGLGTRACLFMWTWLRQGHGSQ